MRLGDTMNFGINPRNMQASERELCDDAVLSRFSPVELFL